MESLDNDKCREIDCNCGVPSGLLESERQWWYLLEHGEHPELEWGVRDMKENAAITLLRFLKSEYLNNEASSCIAEIRQLLKLESH